MIAIRDGTVHDCPALLNVLCQAFAQQRGNIDPESGVFSETVESLSERLQKETLRVAIDQTAAVKKQTAADNAPIGCIFFHPEENGLYFGRLAVHPEYRGKGIARALIQQVENEAAQSGYESVILNVRISLRENIAFFESLGYEITSSQAHKGYATPTYYVMEKSITKRSS